MKTDHKPLREIFEKKGLDAVSARIRRWVINLQEYNFKMEYIPGIKNQTADCLSRMVGEKHKNKGDEEEEVFEEYDVCQITKGVISEEEWEKSMEEDEVLREVMRRMKGLWTQRERKGMTT